MDQCYVLLPVWCFASGPLWRTALCNAGTPSAFINSGSGRHWRRSGSAAIVVARAQFGAVVHRLRRSGCAAYSCLGSQIACCALTPHSTGPAGTGHFYLANVGGGGPVNLVLLGV